MLAHLFDKLQAEGCQTQGDGFVVAVSVTLAAVVESNAHAQSPTQKQHPHLALESGGQEAYPTSQDPTTATTFSSRPAFPA
jgi:hypothetical protein